MTICRFIFILLSIYACHARSPHKRSIIDPDFKVTMASLASVSSTAPQMTTHKLSSRYLQSTSRKITLDDGRVVKCQVPLLDDSSFDQQLLNDTDIVPETRKLTTEEAEPFLMYLKDECTYHRTNDFLWEFCHNKYIRQFDDEITIHNARKPAPELFFLGFHSSVDPQKYIRAIRPEMGPYPPEIDYDLPLRGEVPLERYLHTHGHIAKIVNIRSFHRHNPDTLYFIRAYVPAKELNDSAIVDVNGKTLKYYKKAKKESRITKIIDGNKYIKLERFLVRVLNSDTALLENEFPMDISTKHTKIFPYTGKIDKRSWLNRTVVETITQEMLLFKNYVYGRKAFLSTADAYSSVLLINNKSQVFSKTIVEVIDDSILRIAEDLEKSDIQPHTLILIENNGLYKNLKFTQGNGKIWAMGNVVLGKGTSFKKDFERGDLIMLLKGVNSTWTEHSFEVLKVIHDTLLIVRNPITASKIKSSTSLYMIGKPFDLEKYAQQFSENRTLYKDNSVNSINTETLNNLLLIRTGKKIEEDEPFCHPSFYFPDSRSWLMTFEPRLFNRNANLMLHFSNTACNTEEGIEVNFNHMEELIITDPHDRMRPLRAPLIRNPKTKIKAYRAIVWMIFNQGTLTIGQGDPISLENQILSMKLSNEIELSHYTINKQFSYNLELANIQVQTLPSTLQDTFDLMRNFTAIRGNATYIESYGQGTYCGASKFERRTDVEYKCSKNDAFFEIEKVEEDATCHYHLVVGTNLLCPDKRRDQKIAQKTFNINCIVEDV